MLYDLPFLKQGTDMSESNYASFSFCISQNMTFYVINLSFVFSFLIIKEKKMSNRNEL